jgi:hypothetical protein
LVSATILLDKELLLQMSSQDLFHSVRNELVVVLGRVELLASVAADQTTLEHTRQIKAAALNIRQLLQTAQQNDA